MTLSPNVAADAAKPVVFGASRSWFSAVRLGWRGCCPRCTKRTLFTSYVKMAPSCSNCGLDFEPFRADDAPAYFTILLVGHIIVPAMVMLEGAWAPSLWVLAAIWPPITLALCLVLLPRIKGAVIAFQWAMNMRPGHVEPI